MGFVMLFCVHAKAKVRREQTFVLPRRARVTLKLN